MPLANQPYLSSSDKAFAWTLVDDLRGDSFAFQREGSAALLLIAMHLSDARPWTAARNPLYLARSEGFIDQATKRILGKRFRPAETPAERCIPLDPFTLVLDSVAKAKHDFTRSEITFPEALKEPGKLLARNLTAKATIVANGKTRNYYARNFTEISQCLHAELTLLIALSQAFSHEPSTRIESFELETTLKPCRMCAAFLQQMKSYTKTFHVRYERDDPGPLAQDTLLDRHGYSVIPK